MYFGQHPHNLPMWTEWQTSLARLLDRPQAAAIAGKAPNIDDKTLSVQAMLAAAADKYQMPQGFMEGCKTAYINRIWNGWHGLRFLLIIPDFMAGRKIGALSYASFVVREAL